ncbi:MAG: glycosyltransferase family 1 protein [Gemmataceae bacterium]
MRVVINGLAALKPKTGVGHHVAELAAALAAGFPGDSFTLYPGDRAGRLLKRLAAGPSGGGRGSRRAARPPHRPEAAPAAVTDSTGSQRQTLPGSAGASPSPVRRLRAFIKEVAKSASGAHFAAYTSAFRFDLYHEPNFVPFATRLPTVVTVHDLSVVRFPEWHPADRVRLHDALFRTRLERAERVIVVSDAVRAEAVRLLGIPPTRVVTVHNGISPRFRPHAPAEVEPVRQRLGLPARYFLCVGTIEPRKNVGTVIRAFADLPADVRGACPLVLAGPWGWKADADRELFDRIGKPAGVRHLGYVPDADLPAVYAGAAGLVYPTRYEGFGLPPAEMLATSGAVLASTDPAVREVCGRHAEFLDPDDVAGWRDAMHRLATDADYQRHLAAGGPEHARQFNWPRAARETMTVYRQVLGQPGPGSGAPRLRARPAA